jgi:hypothetical protein
MWAFLSSILMFKNSLVQQMLFEALSASSFFVFSVVVIVTTKIYVNIFSMIFRILWPHHVHNTRRRAPAPRALCCTLQPCYRSGAAGTGRQKNRELGARQECVRRWTPREVVNKSQRCGLPRWNDRHGPTVSESQSPRSTRHAAPRAGRAGTGTMQLCRVRVLLLATLACGTQ